MVGTYLKSPQLAPLPEKRIKVEGDFEMLLLLIFTCARWHILTAIGSYIFIVLVEYLTTDENITTGADPTGLYAWPTSGLLSLGGDRHGHGHGHGVAANGNANGVAIANGEMRGGKGE